MKTLRKVNSQSSFFQSWLHQWPQEQIDSLGIEELIEEGIFNLFLEIPTLQELVREKDFLALEPMVHSLKGMLTSLRISGLSECFTQLNELVRRGDFPEFSQIFSPLWSQILEILDQVTEKVPDSIFRILIAEDHELSRRMMKAFLQPTHFFFRLVCNGKEALRALKATEYDAVFLDIQMPVMGGLAALKEIRKEESLQNLFVTALSADTSAEINLDFQKEGFDAYLEKPFTMEKFQEVIESIPSHRRRKKI